MQKFINDDKNLALLAILTIATVFANAIAAHLRLNLGITLQFGPVRLNRHLLLTFTYAIAVTLLFDTFFAVAGYYLSDPG